MSDHYRKLENMMHSAPVVKFAGATVVVGEGTAEIAMSVKNDMFHSAGAMHGALYFLALDNAAFFACNSLVDDVFVLTSSFTTYITRPVSAGRVITTGKVVNRTQTQFIAESVMVDEKGRELARGNGLFVRSRIALTPEIGYA